MSFRLFLKVYICRCSLSSYICKPDTLGQPLIYGHFSDPTIKLGHWFWVLITLIWKLLALCSLFCCTCITLLLLWDVMEHQKVQRRIELALIQGQFCKNLSVVESGKWPLINHSMYDQFWNLCHYNIDVMKCLVSNRHEKW